MDPAAPTTIEATPPTSSTLAPTRGIEASSDSFLTTEAAARDDPVFDPPARRLRRAGVVVGADGGRRIDKDTENGEVADGRHDVGGRRRRRSRFERGRSWRRASFGGTDRSGGGNRSPPWPTHHTDLTTPRPPPWTWTRCHRRHSEKDGDGTVVRRKRIIVGRRSDGRQWRRGW